MARTFRIGSLVLTPVSDGSISLDPAVFWPEVPRQEWISRANPDENGKIRVSKNCLLVQAGDRRILIDTGHGPAANGQLSTELAQLGLAPTAIDTVVLSHAHLDHVGGATVGTGDAARPLYQNARYWMARDEWTYFTGDDVLAKTPPLRDKLLPLDRSGCLELADGEQDIAPGVRLLPAPGHTVGHVAVAFTSGGETGLYVGDLIHHPVQADHPDWSPVFDALPPLSRETRRRLLDRARREGSLVLAYHFPFPGVGRVGSSGWTAAEP